MKYVLSFIFVCAATFILYNNLKKPEKVELSEATKEAIKDFPYVFDQKYIITYPANTISSSNMVIIQEKRK